MKRLRDNATKFWVPERISTLYNSIDLSLSVLLVRNGEITWIYTLRIQHIFFPKIKANPIKNYFIPLNNSEGITASRVLNFIYKYNYVLTLKFPMDFTI